MRRIRGPLLLIIGLAFAAPLARSAGPESALTITKNALTEAGQSKRNVLLIFHASWCGWCKRLDAALEKEEVKKIIDRFYVVARLDVMESAGKKEQLENPGGVNIMRMLGGEKSGLPFYAFLDPSGKKLADSNALPKGQNIGYPATKEEVTAFEKLLRVTSPDISDRELEVILKNVGEKPKG